MKNLNPTLWRTCKMLAGQSRVRLLRALYTQPGQSVSELGRVVGLREPATSQELRRIQSRGLLQATRRGRYLIYQMAADPQVVSAAPILKAIRESLATLPPERDIEMVNIGNALAHERRIRLIRQLLQQPLPLGELLMNSRIPIRPFYLHLQTLQAGGFIVILERQVQLITPPHPLAKALIRLIQQGMTR